MSPRLIPRARSFPILDEHLPLRRVRDEVLAVCRQRETVGQPADALTVPPLVREGLPRPLADHPAFPFRDDCDERVEHLAGGRRGVHGFLNGHEVHIMPPGFLAEPDEVPDGARQAVELRDDDRVEAAALPLEFGEKAAEAGALEVLGTESVVPHHLDAPPPDELTVPPDFRGLSVEAHAVLGLLVGADPDIRNGIHDCPLPVRQAIW